MNNSIIPSTPDKPGPVTTEPAPTDHKKRSAWRELFSTIGILAIALLTAFFIITFVFRSYQVDGPSMESSLQNSDKLIIWKVPRSWARITNHAYIPQRGDIVVFQQKGLGEFGQVDSKQLIKRVVALPGERVVIKDSSLTVYNEARPGGFSPDRELPYGKENPLPATSGNIDVTLAADQLYVVGDNRPESLDSRAFGPIDADQVIGKLILRVFPISEAKAF